MINSNAKNAIRKRTQRVTKQRKKTFAPKRIKHEETSQLLTEESSDAGSGFETSKDDRTQQEEKTGKISTNEKRSPELKYTKGPAAYGSVKNLEKRTILKPSKVILFLDGKNSHMKHKKNRKICPTLKVIDYDVNDIWSLELAYVDKLAKENKDVK